MSDGEARDWGAQLDQVRAGIADFAIMIGSYHRALVAEGFAQEQALMLTLAWQEALMEAQRS